MSLSDIFGSPVMYFIGIFAFLLFVGILVWLDSLSKRGGSGNDLSNRGVIKRPPDDSKPGRKNPHGTKRPGGGTRVGKFNADGSLRNNEEDKVVTNSDQFTK